MCPTCYMDQTENGGETAKALPNPAGSQTKTRPDESHFWLCRILWKYILIMVLFLVFLIIAVIVLAVVSSRPCPKATTCPVNWIGSQGKTYPWKCYYFSQVDGDWNSSQNNCSSLGASLATVDTREEKEFMLHYKGRSETWIGLTREQADKPWKWVNDTPFNDQFPIRGGGECAYLNDDKGDCGMREPFLSSLCRGSTTDTFCEQQTKEITQERKAKDFRQCPHWHQLVLKIGAAGYVVLLMTVIVLSVWVFQGSSGNGLAPEGEAVSERLRNESNCVASQEKWSYLKQYLCDPPQISSTEGARCVLCPRDWLPYKGKCYWVSKENRMWNSSHDDCLMKSSRLLVARDQEEMDYIQTITTEKNSLWIGLNFKSHERMWIWVDGAPFNGDLAGRPGGRDCGVLKRKRIASETCSAELKWICQKDALLI